MGAILFSSFWTWGSHKTDGPIQTIVIDAGHGGKDPGAVGKNNHEKDIALKIALDLKELINTNMKNVRVILTRGDDIFVPLKQRGKIAQLYNADFFISIHCNASTNAKAFGSTTYVLGVNKGQDRYRSYIRENQSVLFEKNYKQDYGGFDPKSAESQIFFSVMKNVFRKESTILADKIQDQFKNRLGRKDIGVKQGPFIVLWGSAIPSVLVETGFISNPEEEKFLASRIGQLYLASAIYRALRDYNHELGK